MSKFLRSISVVGLLLCSALTQLSAQTRSPEETIKYINDLQATVKNRRALITELRPDVSHQLPIGVLKNRNDSDKPAIIIDAITLHPDKATLTAYAAIMLPGASSPIYFETAQPVTLSYKGGLLETARLQLVNDKKIELGQTTLTIKGGADTYIDFDCKGFKEASLTVEADLHPNLIKEMGAGTQNSSTRAKATFTLKFQDLNDIVAIASIEPFQIKGIKDVTFSVQEAVVDLSDFSNAESMVFPSGYEQQYFGGVNIGLWRGFYLKSARVVLPPELKTNGATSARKEITATGLLIDNHGFSGEITARNLMSIEEGNLGGWEFSVDSIGLAFKANQLIGAGMAGGIVLPISKKETQLGYTAAFHPGKFYTFSVKTVDKLEFPIFKAADVVLNPGSSVTIGYTNTDSKFSASANLSGVMTINASLSSNESETASANKALLPAVKFEQLQISNTSPYLHSGTFLFNSQVKIGGFTASINKIQVINSGETRGLGIALSVGLMKGKDAFAAAGDLQILGKMVVSATNRQRFQYETTRLSSLSLDIDQGAFSLYGAIAFFKQDATYGSGFSGKLDVKLPLQIRVGATAMFGTVNGSSYWYTDALAEFGKGIPVSPMLEINGFSGGLYYGVKQVAGGSEVSGLTYTPDRSVGFGLKAGVIYGLTGKKSMFNGTVGFEVIFNRNGGLSKIQLMGNANLLKQPSSDIIGKVKNAGAAFAKKVGNGPLSKEIANNMETDPGKITASVLMDFNFDNRTFYANFQVYVNVGVALRGINDGGLAGQGTLYFAPDTWYIHLGTPSIPIGVEMLKIARTRAYFMVGKDLPGSPPPHEKVSEILGGKNLDYMRDLNSLSSGKGIAFGAGMDISTGDLVWGIFFANFGAGAGFDVMVKDYGSQAKCESNGQTIGVNGWYANGQVYAYVYGQIGLTAKVFGKRRKLTILDIGAAAILQAKFPNPSWMHGEVGGHYRLLGGLIKGHCSFEFTLGSECNIIGTDALADNSVKVIAEVKPGKGETDVNVFNTPKVLFNIPIGQEFAIKDQQDRDLLFRAKLDEFVVKADNQIITGTHTWNGDNTQISFSPSDILPPKKRISAYVKISFEENVNGGWRTYTVDGKPYSEEESTEFTTGNGPEIIPANNVAYSYPMANQLSYYKGESQSGYIKLISNQGYLLNAADQEIFGRLKSANGTTADFAVSYSNNQINFTMPAISNDIGYELAIYTKSVNSSSNNAKQIFSSNFHSSKYNTFSDKFADIASGSTSTIEVRDRVHQLIYTVRGTELFDDYELNEYNKLISLEADLSATPWYDSDVRPYVYESYPINNALRLNNRNTSLLGLPPTRAIYIRNDNNQTGLKYTAGQSVPIGDVSIVYNLPHYMDMDYWEMQNKVARIMGSFLLKKTIGTSIPATMKEIVNRPFSPISSGTYKVKVKYILPGTQTVTSEREILINKTN